MHKATWKHRIRDDEVKAAAGSPGSQPLHFTIVVRDPRIDSEEWNEVYVRGTDGWEPAAHYSRHGVGSVFKEIAFETGKVRMEIADHANQQVRDPRGMRLRFYVRPTLAELTAR